MYDYIVKELPEIINNNFNVYRNKQGIMGIQWEVPAH